MRAFRTDVQPSCGDKSVYHVYPGGDRFFHRVPYFQADCAAEALYQKLLRAVAARHFKRGEAFAFLRYKVRECGDQALRADIPLVVMLRQNVHIAESRVKSGVDERACALVPAVVHADHRGRQRTFGQPLAQFLRGDHAFLREILVYPALGGGPVSEYEPVVEHTSVLGFQCPDVFHREERIVVQREFQVQEVECIVIEVVPLEPVPGIVRVGGRYELCSADREP